MGVGYHLIEVKNIMLNAGALTNDNVRIIFFSNKTSLKYVSATVCRISSGTEIVIPTKIE